MIYISKPITQRTFLHEFYKMGTFKYQNLKNVHVLRTVAFAKHGSSQFYGPVTSDETKPRIHTWARPVRLTLVVHGVRVYTARWSLHECANTLKQTKRCVMMREITHFHHHTNSRVIVSAQRWCKESGKMCVNLTSNRVSALSIYMKDRDLLEMPL